MIGDKEKVLNYLEKDKEGDIYEIKRKQKKSIRTLQQNNYYWGVVVPIISQFHGYFEVETHELIKSIFKLETTTGLDTAEFKWLIDQIREIWETKYEVTIPLPEGGLEEQSLMDSFNN